MITRSDKLRIALTPLHLIIGVILLYRFATDGEARVWPVAALGVAWSLYGVYRIALVARALNRNGHPPRHRLGGGDSPRSARLTDRNGHPPRHRLGGGDSPRSARLTE
jgi:hypothetical protein